MFGFFRTSTILFDSARDVPLLASFLPLLAHRKLRKYATIPCKIDCTGKEIIG